MNRRVSIVLAVMLAGWAVIGSGLALSQHSRLTSLRAELANRALAPASDAATPVAVVTSVVTRTVKATVPDAAAAARVAELEADMERLQQKLRDAETANTMAPFRNASNQWWGAGFEQRMEDLKKTDPKRYEEIQQRRQEFQRQREDSLARQSAFLLSVDATTMSEAEASNHAELVNLMTKTWALFDTVQKSPGSDTARAAQGEMRDNMRVLDDLFTTERAAILKQYGKTMGYSENESKQFADAIQQVVDMTSARRMLRGGQRGMFGGPPPAAP